MPSRWNVSRALLAVNVVMALLAVAPVAAQPLPRSLTIGSNPPGTAIATAITIALAHSTRCSVTRVGMPSVPCQLAGSLNHVRR